MERLSLVLCVVLACVVPAMAGPYNGDWYGYTSALDYAPNWEGVGNEWSTEQWSIDPGDAAGGNMPAYDGSGPNGGYISGGSIRFRNGSNMTQTGGAIDLINGGGKPIVLGMYHEQWGWGPYPALQDVDNEWNISGGFLDIRGPLGLGYDCDGNLKDSAGTGGSVVNISGTGIVSLWDQDWQAADLIIADGDMITIADSGALRVVASLTSTVDALIADNKIVGVGGSLATSTWYADWMDVDVYEVTVVPEPATMALLALGALVLRRKK